MPVGKSKNKKRKAFLRASARAGGRSQDGSARGVPMGEAGHNAVSRGFRILEFDPDAAIGTGANENKKKRRIPEGFTG